MISNENWGEELKKCHLKITKGRVHILEELAKASQPVSAEDLYMLLRKKSKRVDLSTVYRALEVFTETKLVCKISIFEDGCKLFALHGKNHCHYLICKECKKIVTIQSCPIELYEKKLENETGFSIDGHSLYLYGICKECANNKKSGIVSENK